jgi:hypothetical protein
MLYQKLTDANSGRTISERRKKVICKTVGEPGLKSSNNREPFFGSRLIFYNSSIFQINTSTYNIYIQ